MADEDDTTELAASGPSADFEVTNPGPGEGWQLAIGLIRAWRGASERADGAVAQKLAEVAAEGGAATAEQAVTGLVAPRAYRPHSLPAARDTSTNLAVVGRAAN